MSRRYYLSPIVGTGTTPDPYRPKLAGLNVAATIPVGANGVPSRTWALCLAAGTDHSGALADATIDALPDITLDTTLAAITAQQRTRLLNALSSRGVDTTGIGTATTLRQVVERVGVALDPAFAVGLLLVGE